MEFDYDLFVIGAGSGGVRLSRMAASYGARVAIAEDSRVGGTCVMRGCIPKKLLVYASHFPHEVEDAAGYGWSYAPGTFSWPTLIEAKNRELARLNAVYIALLEKSGVRLYNDRATVADAHTVDVSGQRVSARHIAIATGARPMLPTIPGIEHAITSDEALDLVSLPKTIAVVGGGYIAVEFAGIFNGLGVQVDLWHRGKQILRGFDDDVRNALASAMTKQGVSIRTGTGVLGLEKHSDGTVELLLEGGSHGRYDAVLYATGRLPNSAGLGLEQVGVELRMNGAVEVDAYSATCVPSIHAIGDVTARPQLTPVATRDGALLAATLFGGAPRAVDYEYVPSAVFSNPEVATVGLTEEEARMRYDEVDIYRTSFKALRHTLSGRDEITLMKLVVVRGNGRVVGAHMVGRDASEIIQGIAIAVKRGATKDQFDETIGIHPTAAEEFVTMRERVPPPE
ncbi:glutathione-disulfide reductase [Paraburkholderia sediminicola]|uniref:glutathione-disulfide reductase n=1 Tax=Paraburkholderia sediminicola TaxID=458836 RepID=UPI0038B95D29